MLKFMTWWIPCNKFVAIARSSVFSDSAIDRPRFNKRCLKIFSPQWVFSWSPWRQAFSFIASEILGNEHQNSRSHACPDPQTLGEENV